ncbi:redox-sensing transcriptional repressor Rex [bacterium]|nr:MAG: redox-sensing transcriptional repressor Rex [bacterium]
MAEYHGPTPVATVERLSVYLRTLQEAKKEGKEFISSIQIGNRNGFTSAQVRKDLSCFGNFGRKGKGYHIDTLISSLRNILGLGKKWKVALMGLGNLGEALAGHKGFQKSGFDIVAIFDIDTEKIGTKYKDIPVYHPEKLSEIAGKENIEIAIIAVPNSAAKKSIQRVVDANIKGILNFTNVRLPLEKEFVMKNINLASELETISYYLTHPDRICRGV